MIAVRQADGNDIEALLRLRLDYFRLTGAALPAEEERTLAENIVAYFEKNLGTECLSAFLAELDGHVAGGALLAITDRPPGRAMPLGRIGTVFNVLTYPQYRRRGVARSVMAALIEAARASGLTSVDLLATEDGWGLYNELGFAALPLRPMWLAL